jgi:hypothetical protein
MIEAMMSGGSEQSIATGEEWRAPEDSKRLET